MPNVENYQNLIRKEKRHLSNLKRYGYVPGIFKMIANAMFNIQHYERMMNQQPPEDKHSLKGIFKGDMHSSIQK